MKRIRLSYFMLTIPVVLASGCASVETKEEAVKERQSLPLVGEFQVQRYVLDNGLRLLIVEDHSSPTLAYQTWYRVGSRDEVPGYTGLAHLFEHMMFKGTKNHPDGEYDRILDQIGSEGMNAFTSRDYTAYIQEVPKDKLDLVASLESDRMVNLVVDEHSFKTEREVVQNERRYRNENSPEGLMYQELFGLAFKKHPYHWPVIGYQQDLDRMTAQDARKFYHSYYSPNHATILIVGDVDPDAALATIQKHYGNIPSQASPIHVTASEPEQKAPRTKTLNLNIQVPKLMMGFHVPAVTDPDYPTLILLDSLLAGGKSSRLYRALVDAGIASSVETYELDDKDPSLFIIATNLQKGHKTDEAEAVIIRELEKLANDGAPDAEIERARNKMNFGYFEGLGSDMEKAGFLGRYESLGNSFLLGIQIHERAQVATSNEVRTVLKRYFKPENRTVVIGVLK